MPNTEDESSFHCAICTKPESDEGNLIFCDGCQQYFHCTCQNVPVTAKDDDSWMCEKCIKNATVVALTDADIDEAAKRMQKELEQHRANLELKSKLATLKLEMVFKKRELEWRNEQDAVERKISAEKAFNEKCKQEREIWKEKLIALAEERKQAGVEFEAFLKGVQSAKNVTSKEKRKKKKNRSKSGGTKGKQSQESDSETSSTETDVQLKSEPHNGPTKTQLTTRQYLSWNLPKFSGNPSDWPIFISSFKTSTDACGFSNVENLVRLQDAIRGPAREIVGGRLILPKTVPQVIGTLQQLYGRPEQMLHALLAKVRRAEAPKIDRMETFIRFGTIVEQLCDHLEATGLRDHLVNPLLINELIDKLPAITKMEWVRFKRAKQVVTLRTFTTFLSEIVEVACEVVNYAELTSNSKSPKHKEHRSIVAVHDAEGGSHHTTDARWPCPACGETSHRLRNCDEFREMDYAERMELVEEKNLCHLCLCSHGNARCKFNIRCNIEHCQERHNTLLHPSNSDGSD